MTRSTLSRSINGALAPAAVFGLLAAAGSAGAQEPPMQLVDRIVAVVGDTAILQSELQQFVFTLQAQGIRVPRDPDQLGPFLKEVLDQKVNQVLLVVHAEREGITVTDAEINEIVDDRIAQVRRQFPSQLEFEQALANEGVTPAEYRLRVTAEVRAELLSQRYLQMKVSQLQPIPVSEDEIGERFEAQKQSYGTKPATVTLKQIIITPEPSPDARLAAREKAEQALSRARAGEDFARLAREYSDDPASRQKGGELGWVRKGELVPRFEDALFRMRAGEISDIVESSFGYHIIKLDRIRGNERSARHILVQPEMTPEDTARTHRLAEEVAAALRAGADPDSLIRLYADPTERSSLTDFAQERLPAEYRTALEGAGAGDVVDPFLMAAPGVFGGKWIVAKVLAMNPGGEWRLDDVRETLRLQIQQERMLQKVVDDLREATYIELRLDAIDAMTEMFVGEAVTR
jgi:peptidyl-prolyl cis-trans isomerase SurA